MGRGKTTKGISDRLKSGAGLTILLRRVVNLSIS